MKQSFRLFLIVMTGILIPFAASAQVTTSGMNGHVTDESGEPLPGAAVVAVHAPSGTQYSAVTNTEGRYVIGGMRPGGPYSVRILYIGMEGEASVQVPVTAPDGKKGMEEYRLRKGDAMLIPAEVTDFFIVPTDRDTVLMEVIAGKRDETDGYINPDTEPFLEGEDYEGLEDEETEEKDQAEAADIDGPQGRHNMKWS